MISRFLFPPSFCLPSLTINTTHLPPSDFAAANQEYEKLVNHGVFERRVHHERRRLAAIERRAKEQRERAFAAAAAAAKAAAERGASAIDPLMMMAMQSDEDDWSPLGASGHNWQQGEEMEGGPPRAMARQAKISVKMLKRIIEREEVTRERTNRKGRRTTTTKSAATLHANNPNDFSFYT